MLWFWPLLFTYTALWLFCGPQGLFRNYGDTFLPYFREHILELLSDRSHEHHESKQRCGMEILAGVIRGSKHWPYPKVLYYCYWGGGNVILGSKHWPTQRYSTSITWILRVGVIRGCKHWPDPKVLYRYYCNSRGWGFYKGSKHWPFPKAMYQYYYNSGGWGIKGF